MTRAKALPQYEMTLDEIGEVLHVSRERVRQIEKSALDKLRRECRRIGLDPADLVEDWLGTAGPRAAR